MSIEHIHALSTGLITFVDQAPSGANVIVLCREDLAKITASLEATEPATERRREIVEGLAARFPWITDDETGGTDALEALAAWIQEGFAKRPTVYACDLCGKWHPLGVGPECKRGVDDPSKAPDIIDRAQWAMAGKAMAELNHKGYQHNYQKGVCIFKGCKHTEHPATVTRS